MPSSHPCHGCGSESLRSVPVSLRTPAGTRAHCIHRVAGDTHTGLANPHSTVSASCPKAGQPGAGASHAPSGLSCTRKLRALRPKHEKSGPCFALRLLLRPSPGPAAALPIRGWSSSCSASLPERGGAARQRACTARYVLGQTQRFSRARL